MRRRNSKITVMTVKERLGLTEKTIHSEKQNIKNHKSNLKKLIEISFLSEEMKEKYLDLLSNRFKKTGCLNSEDFAIKSYFKKIILRVLTKSLASIL